MSKKKNKDILKIIRKNNVRTFILAIIILGISLIIFSWLYTTIKERVIEASINNMEELSKHDEKNIMASLSYRFEDLDGIVKEMMQHKFDTTKEMLTQLNIKAQTINAIEVVLVNDEGTLYNSSFTIINDDEILDLCKKSESKFVYRRDNITTSYETQQETLLLGEKIEPFTVEDNKFVYVICYYDIDSLTDDLKIDSFDGAGYSSVIDFDGNFIVSVEHETDLFERDNFYNIMSKAEIHDKLSIDDLHKKISNRESFSINYKIENQERVMTLTPMEDLGWYFIMVVPRVVCENQSSSFFQIITVLILFILLFVTIVLVLVLRNRLQRKLMNIEVKHRDELEGALVLANQANRAKTVFLNNMSHDIRTPMNAIIGFTTLAKTHINDQTKVKDYLDKISQSSKHLLSLINDVLDMSRIESGKVTIEEKEENLFEIIDEIKNIMQADILTKSIDFSIDMDDVSDEYIYCDKLRVNQILINLLSNALKYTPAGGKIYFKISEKASEQNGYSNYEFRVRDTGIGMSEEFLKAIFEPFSRERSSTVSGIQGTGIGMTITKNLIEMMKGKIEVHSELGKGSEFIVNIPFKLQHILKDVKKNDENVLNGEIEDFKGKRILLVEDNMMNREISTEYLQDFGFLVENAEDGSEACEILKNSEKGYFDLVLMDIQMPIMNGYDATRTIRKFEDKDIANIPIIAMTANAFEEDKKEAMESGMDGHLAKPIEIPELIRTLKKVLNSRRNI